MNDITDGESFVDNKKLSPCLRHRNPLLKAAPAHQASSRTCLQDVQVPCPYSPQCCAHDRPTTDRYQMSEPEAKSEDLEKNTARQKYLTELATQHTHHTRRSTWSLATDGGIATERRSTTEWLRRDLSTAAAAACKTKRTCPSPLRRCLLWVAREVFRAAPELSTARANVSADSDLLER